MSKAHEIDLYSRLRAQHKDKAGGTASWLKRLLPILLIALCLSLAWVLMARKNRSEQALLDSTVTEIAMLNEGGMVSYSDRLDQDNARLSRDVQYITERRAAITSYPVVNSDVLNEVRECGGDRVNIELVSYDANEGLLRFNAVSEQVLDIPSYIRLLEDTALFNTVDYTGYAYTEQEAAYSIQVTCYLDESAGKEVTQ